VGKYSTFEQNENQNWDYASHLFGDDAEEKGSCSYCGSAIGEDNEGLKCPGSQIGFGCQSNRCVACIRCI
jgi:hypothetical protein